MKAYKEEINTQNHFEELFNSLTKLASQKKDNEKIKINDVIVDLLIEANKKRNQKEACLIDHPFLSNLEILQNLSYKSPWLYRRCLSDNRYIKTNQLKRFIQLGNEQDLIHICKRKNIDHILFQEILNYQSDDVLITLIKNDWFTFPASQIELLISASRKNKKIHIELLERCEKDDLLLDIIVRHLKKNFKIDFLFNFLFLDTQKKAFGKRSKYKTFFKSKNTFECYQSLFLNSAYMLKEFNLGNQEGFVELLSQATGLKKYVIQSVFNEFNQSSFSLILKSIGVDQKTFLSFAHIYINKFEKLERDTVPLKNFEEGYKKITEKEAINTVNRWKKTPSEFNSFMNN